jgi:hypothetical protein
MGFVEETEAYIAAVRTFLDAILAAR